MTARRLLFVHAHPDDESINNGVTMARYVAEGAQVTLVTCTRGEEGEVIPPELAGLAADRDDTLGPYRVGELAEAMRQLGVSDHRFLGGAGRYRDSGMIGTPPNQRPDCFWRTPVDDAADLLAAVIRETRPQVLVTYDPDGGYGHPDHIQAHRVATRAVELAALDGHRPELGAPHRVRRVYWNCVARSQIGPDAFDGNPFAAAAGPDDVPGVVDDTLVAVRITGDGGLSAAKSAAMRAHATQITVNGGFFALSNHLGQPLLDTECYRLADGSVPAGAPAGDLFAGVDL
ncbi:N-acetyl-1-D-myo-inositol-2-amino-2-deoxy-alpha-D-glucopyranoside deacetylase [Streptomyces sp. 549]|uniref:N-acetyl-1-D-myo-inositol-2-amino-2-deoxy-alpha- D-glucopyranoside deacetylase n=1 Tax=Streptomyces sp. 549 TaxID=3049076 RepID=UPI0024C27FBB|nr:N-acetyl-1-D-myo-inositol-2-amino-2-deoxy-alpha-D-glucopyranoside deacetylase [Streptomyces sp. 549]MDK1476246.1 N-acetyl-1-D-myo-inositol-2-amino-2-deoxy-alpha-D-glucopyranoside deacetylase [Streptomyces sp. 549]